MAEYSGALVAPSFVLPSSWCVVEAVDNDAWLKARDTRLTGSDVSAVLGCNPNKSRASVIRAKVAARDGVKAPERVVGAMYAGQFQEAGVFAWFLRDRTADALALGESAPVGATVRNPNGTSVLVDYPDPALRLAASPDAVMVTGDGQRQLVEVKVCGPGKARLDDEAGWVLEVPGSWAKWDQPCKSKAWREIGGGRKVDCPVPHYIQLQTQLLCTGEEFGWVVGCCGTAKREHPFGRDEELMDRIICATKDFWLDVDSTC